MLVMIDGEEHRTANEQHEKDSKSTANPNPYTLVLIPTRKMVGGVDMPTYSVGEGVPFVKNNDRTE